MCQKKLIAVYILTTWICLAITEYDLTKSMAMKDVNCKCSEIGCNVDSGLCVVQNNHDRGKVFCATEHITVLYIIDLRQLLVTMIRTLILISHIYENHWNLDMLLESLTDFNCQNVEFVILSLIYWCIYICRIVIIIYGDGGIFGELSSMVNN